MAVTVENVGNGLPGSGTAQIHRKTPSPVTTRNGPPCSRMTRQSVEDDVDQHHPTGLCDAEELPRCFLDGMDQSEASPDPFDRFPP